MSTDTNDGGEWIVVDHDNDNRRPAPSRSKAEDMAQTARDLESENVEIIPPGGNSDPEPDGGQSPDVIDAQPVEHDPETVPATTEERADELPAMSVNEDPLDILPSYMIDEVQGEPTLNKRGLSVLAFHYDVTVTNREIIVSPHESEWESAIVETTVTNGDGNEFVGTGTAHVDRDDDKEILLEMAETRSYKRAVSFATGTGIVSYQEMTSELER